MKNYARISLVNRYPLRDVKKGVNHCNKKRGLSILITMSNFTRRLLTENKRKKQKMKKLLKNVKSYRRTKRILQNLIKSWQIR